MELSNITGLKGKITVPGDKSISHRAVMFGALAKGTTEIHHFLNGYKGYLHQCNICIHHKNDCLISHHKLFHIQNHYVS